VTRVVLFGAGQVASLVHYYLTHDSQHEVVAFTVDGSHLTEPSLFDLPIVPFDDVEALYPPDDFGMMVAIGFTMVNRLRAEKYAQAKNKGYQLISYVSSTATTWPDLNVGDNCVVMEDTVIQPFARIGNNVTLGPGCCIGHHSVISDHCLLASHVDVSGGATVEPYCFLGANSTIRNGITIASEGVVGAGVAILRNTLEREVYSNPPAVRLAIPSNKLPRI
jgi:sugar O-acyltransferase (sialic acid O-acetyltransferase NeuD family)